MPFAGADRRPEYVTVWVSLTATDDSCAAIHLIPADRDPFYFHIEPAADGEEVADLSLHAEDIYSEALPLDALQSIRSIPTGVGDFLCWTGRLFHFGGAIWGPREVPGMLNAPERLSVSFAFSSESFEPQSLRLQDALPLAMDRLPSLDQRVAIVAAQLWTYEHYAPHPPWLKALLEEIEQKTKRESENPAT